MFKLGIRSSSAEGSRLKFLSSASFSLALKIVAALSMALFVLTLGYQIYETYLVNSTYSLKTEVDIENVLQSKLLESLAQAKQLEHQLSLSVEKAKVEWNQLQKTSVFILDEKKANKSEPPPFKQIWNDSLSSDVLLNLQAVGDLFQKCKTLEDIWASGRQKRDFQKVKESKQDLSLNFTSCLSELKGFLYSSSKREVSMNHFRKDKQETCDAIRIMNSMPGLRMNGSRMFSKGIWKSDPVNNPPRLNVSFLLQYFKHPKSAMQIVENLYRCTNGKLGTGELPGITSQLLVNVDEASGWKVWRALRNQTKEGEFLKFVFNHNVHEGRGYNFMETMAESDILVMLQDDNILSRNCLWITDLLKTFNTLPRVAGVSLWRASMSHAPGDTSKYSELHDWPNSADTGAFLLVDPVTGVRMHFVTHGNLGPMAFRRGPFVEVGGIDIGIFGKKGESGIFQDEDLSVRLVLAGYQVAHMFIRERFDDGPEGSGTRTRNTISNHLRNLNMLVEGVYKDFTLQPFGQRIEDEVLRLNQFLLAPNPFPPVDWKLQHS